MLVIHEMITVGVIFSWQSQWLQPLSIATVKALYSTYSPGEPDVQPAIKMVIYMKDVLAALAESFGKN